MPVLEPDWIPKLAYPIISQSSLKEKPNFTILSIQQDTITQVGLWIS